jgi:hypothetical protein
MDHFEEVERSQKEAPAMGPVEADMLAYIQRRLEQGALSVTEQEIMDAVVPHDHPEYRERPAYRYGLERLRRRHVINAVADQTGTLHYFIGNYPSAALFRSLGLPSGDGGASMRRLAVGGLVACAFLVTYFLLVGALMYANVVAFNPHRRGQAMWREYWIAYTIFYSPSVAAALLAAWCSRLPPRGVSVLLGVFLVLIGGVVQWTLQRGSGGGALLMAQLASVSVLFFATALMCRWTGQSGPRG